MTALGDATKLEEATQVDHLSALPRELRDEIYSYLILPPLGIRIQYPPRSTDGKMLVSPLFHVNSMIRGESWSIVYQNVHLVMVPQPTFAYSTIATARLISSMPPFARYVDSLTVKVQLRAPHDPKCTVYKKGLERPSLSPVKLTFQMNAEKRYKMTGIAVLHGPYGNRGIVERFMEAKVEELEETMVAVLETNRALRTRLWKKKHSPFIGFAPRLPQSVLGAF
ncbi:unnamed protein product [Zymoseptoria tritici ST99CH_1E4]|uniref:F-box domain-containing protein n=1 Tax=Zymoseptoria tritici ST99CH_1E4 TaxID=1276532 RepID=A0A2H1GPW8_ZYMTR|nr:unnamed protein product [Zymoseptoria tritici ST99CH_1E4]